jgi:hypothetical protein
MVYVEAQTRGPVPGILRKGASMSQAEAAVQAALQEIVKELKAIHRRLLELLQGLPAGTLEDFLYASEDEVDLATEIRTVIECVLQDSILPAIRDLEAVAAYQGEKRERKEN